MTGDFCLRLRENAPLEEQARLAAKKADHDHCAEKFWQCNLSDQSYAVSARALFALRFFLDRIFGWDQEPAGGKPKYFAERLTREDRERSTVPAGTPERFFRMVYSFENETLLEVINRTAHGALLTALAETPQVYRFYLAVYVRELSWVTLAYVALIDPFCRWLVHRAILKQVERNWEELFQRDAEQGRRITGR